MCVFLIAKTIDVEKMKTLEKNIIELYNQGLLISINVGLRYYFNKINDIKSEMLVVSIKNFIVYARITSTIYYYLD
ncbi:hypothetical protein QIA23_01630 [Borreliella lanei]|uniref:Uncharacterized protein n=2 Tax=Borreliella lanei TaxID=373540 RepID=A0A7W9ZAM8_9SPIR|nr:hypothetical protein [Borreliella lanei]MBB6207936.1 hypothetical protein [Borreliella lanei]